MSCIVNINPAVETLPNLASGLKGMAADASYFREHQSLSIMMLSIQRPLPSIEIRIPASLSTSVKASRVNWLP